MEIKTKHKKFKTFSDLYQFMCESHLDEINVTIKYPDKSKNNGTMPIELNHFDDEDGTLSAQLEEIDATSEIKEEIQQLVASRLQ